MQKRVSKSALVYISVGSLLIVFLSLFGVSVFLRILEIEIDGLSMYSEDEIILASGIEAGDSLMFFNASAVEQRIHSEMPFINDVKISRLPPNGVRIEVTESLAIATIATQDGILVIDSSGRVLKSSDTAPSGLIEVIGLIPTEGTEGSQLKVQVGGEMQLQYMKDVLLAIEREGIQSGVSYLDVTNISIINFGYQDRFKVILGGPSNARSKLSQLPGFIEGINSELSTDVKGDINMSDPSGEWRFVEDW